MRSLFLIISIVFAGCEYEHYQPSKKQKLANAVRHKAATQVHQETGLRPCGTGGQMMNKIHMLALSFFYYQEIDIKKGRELLIESVDRFMSAVNEDEQIRPYLGNYPFQPKNVQIRIFVKNPDRSDLEPGKICVISALDGILEYETTDLSLPRFKTVHKETYEEAVYSTQAARFPAKSFTGDGSNK